jgi:uncharacterized ubiquitin-like protein YukD
MATETQITAGDNGYIRVFIIDPTGAVKSTVELPTRVPINRLIRALITRLQLPRTSRNDQYIGYELVMDNDVETVLDQDVTLAEAGVMDGDTLRLKFGKVGDGTVEFNDALLDILASSMIKSRIPAYYSNQSDDSEQSTQQLLSELLNVFSASQNARRLWDVTVEELVTLIGDEVDKRVNPNLINILETQKTTQEEGEPQEGSMVVKPVFGAHKNDERLVCDVFVIMPFADDFRPIYDYVIKPIGADLGLRIRRGDDIFTHTHLILTEIWSSLVHCQVVVADYTGRNANVFYELGIAHTLGKPCIPITQNLQDIPFDVLGWRAIAYDNSGVGFHQLRVELTAALKVLLAK